MLPTDAAHIKFRADAIGLSLKKLARRRGVDPSTMYRAARGQGENYPRTIKAVGEELVQEERRLLEHLLAIYFPAHPHRTLHGGGP